MRIVWIGAVVAAAVGCKTGSGHEGVKGMEPTAKKPDVEAVVSAVVQAHGAENRGRIERGVRQIAALWRADDGDLERFALAHFIADDEKLDDTFARLESTFEQIDGHLYEIEREVRRPTDLDIGPLLPVDKLLATVNPFAHLSEDLFGSKIAFVVLLNFPLTTLEERMTDGPKWTRRQWAEARLAGRFATRVPPEISQGIAAAGADADLYIAEYNIWMHHLVTDTGERLFPSGLRLISHWNLRDQLKADYADDDNGLAKQRMIVKVMERIVTQTIPKVVIDNPRVDWNPYSNEVKPSPASAIEPQAPERPSTPDTTPESNVRYQKIIDAFHARRRADPYAPSAPTAIARAFEEGRELSEDRVRSLFESVLRSPLVPKIAATIEKRLGRKLEPQDLWYDGFKARSNIAEPELDALTKKKYPTAEAFAADMPRILTGLGFSETRAKFLSEHIIVDASRGAGHAMRALRRGDKPHLRTRIGPEGMTYKGYNIAIHELGHNVEQVFSLYEVDHTLLDGVPNNAFTEALAFVFQARDLELLGLETNDESSEKMRVLSTFWSTWEIAGVALVDTAVWHWLYEHPNATAAALRDATVQIATDLWNEHYAPVLGGEPSVLLGVYSHMIAYPLYLPNYPLGHLIAFQIEEQIEKAGDLGGEFERMSKFGSVTPDVWMMNATRAPVSAEPLLRATEAALQ